MNYLHVTAVFPCPRAGKMALAIPGRHTSVSRKLPAHFPEAWADNIFGPDVDYAAAVRSTPHDMCLFHLELGSAWCGVQAFRATAATKVLVIHDNIESMSMFDPDEEELFALADVFVWVSEGQRADHKLDREGVHFYIPNGPSSTMFLEKGTPLPHVGGLVYGGGVHPRGYHEKWRDISAVADAVDLHIFPANDGVDYGHIHQGEVSNRLLIHRFAQFDWGFSGTVWPNPVWSYNSPNKLGEYAAAGIPFIALNSPSAKEFADMGFGHCVDNVADIAAVMRDLDPKPYRKAIIAQRGQFTMERACLPLVDALC